MILLLSAIAPFTADLVDMGFTSNILRMTTYDHDVHSESVGTVTSRGLPRIKLPDAFHHNLSTTSSTKALFNRTYTYIHQHEVLHHPDTTRRCFHGRTRV